MLLCDVRYWRSVWCYAMPGAEAAYGATRLGDEGAAMRLLEAGADVNFKVASAICLRAVRFLGLTLPVVSVALWMCVHARSQFRTLHCQSGYALSRNASSKCKCAVPSAEMCTFAARRLALTFE
eukprot:1120291-Rhodomonas_salina.1